MPCLITVAAFSLKCVRADYSLAESNLPLRWQIPQTPDSCCRVLGLIRAHGAILCFQPAIPWPQIRAVVIPIKIIPFRALSAPYKRQSSVRNSCE